MSRHTISDEVVTAFVGPEKNQLRLHAYSPTLGSGSTQVILGLIQKAKDAGFGQALAVPDAPDAGGDNFAITSFGVTINKSSKLVTARCKADKFKIDREVTYDDGSKESVSAKQGCRQKGGGGGGGGGGAATTSLDRVRLANHQSPEGGPSGPPSVRSGRAADRVASRRWRGPLEL